MVYNKVFHKDEELSLMITNLNPNDYSSCSERQLQMIQSQWHCLEHKKQIGQLITCNMNCMVSETYRVRNQYITYNGIDYMTDGVLFEIFRA